MFYMHTLWPDAWRQVYNILYILNTQTLNFFSFFFFLAVKALFALFFWIESWFYIPVDLDYDPPIYTSQVARMAGPTTTFSYWLRWGLRNILLWLASNCRSPDLHLLSSWDYRCTAFTEHFITFISIYMISQSFKSLDSKVSISESLMIYV
jgi:hypothetical protein